MSPLIALSLAAPLIYLPGWVLIRTFISPAKPADLLERIYLRVVAGALLNGWLALLLAEFGIFSIWLHVCVVGAVCVASWWVRELRNKNQELILEQKNKRTKEQKGQKPEARSQQSAVSASYSRSERSTVHRPSSIVQKHLPFIIRLSSIWDTLAIALILLAFALGVAARPFETVIGVRDAGSYANTGFAIARTGRLVQFDPIVAQVEADQQSADQELREAAAQAETNFLGVQNRDRTIATRLRQAGFFINEGDMAAGRIVPQGLHLYPVWIGLLTSLGGPQGGLAATGLLGLLGVWSAAMVGRRLAGPWVGVGTALLLALNGVQVWFSRYSTAEAIAQFLIFAGLYCFAAAVTELRNCGVETQDPTTEQRNKDASNSDRAEKVTLSSKSPIVHHPSSVYTLLAGLAFGQVALARIDFPLVIAPVLLYLFWVWLRRRWGHLHTWLGIGLGLMLLHAAIHIVTIARAYFFDTLFARLQDYALIALITFPFLTPPLREVYLLRPCSRIAIQPCPAVKDMPPATFTGWNYPRIATELLIVALAFLALLAFRRWGQPLLATTERLVRRHASLLLSISALAVGLIGGYVYLIRPQVLTYKTLAALPGCISLQQLQAPQGACLELQGYIGAPVAVPAYVDPVMATLGSLPRRLTGRPAPTPTECAALRDSLLPPEAKGRTSVELRADGLIREGQVGAETWAALQLCDSLVLRDLFANSQANLVRVGWYLSPLGVVLAIVGLALLWRRMSAASWLFLVVALIGAATFLRLTYGTSDQHYIYILRRYVPQVYPALCLGIAYALAALGRWTVDCGRWEAEPRNRRTSEIPRTKDQEPIIDNGQRAAIQTMDYQPPATSKPPSIVRRLAATLLAVALLLFTVATNLKIYSHTEYAGALGQIGAIAARFESDDILLMRGGAPTFGQARDIPDNLATPLAYGFGLNAFTVKSAQPGNYATQLAAYVGRWREQGREVYLLAGASGALALPGYSFELVGPAQLRLPEFEQPTSQKPTNVQEYALDFQIYRVVPQAQVALLAQIQPDDYATQVSGFYRAEPLGGQLLAWTNGDALLRLPSSGDSITLVLQLAAGKTRPERLGPPQVCLSFRPEPRPWPEDPEAPPFSTPQCFPVTPEVQSYSFTFVPPETETLLLRIQSDTWIPIRDDPAQRDGRRLGVLFGGMAIEE